MLRKIEEKWGRNFLLCEMYLSILIVIFIAIFVDQYELMGTIQNRLNGIRFSLYATIAQIAGALLGFVIAGVSILLTMKKSENIKFLMISNLYYQIYDVFISSAKCLSLSTIISVFAMVIDRDDAQNISIMYGVLWSIIISSFRMSRCVWILQNIINLHVKSK